MAKAKKKIRARTKALRKKTSVKSAKPANKPAKARPKQKFAVSHWREQDFKGGLRTYAKYRDLGVAKATNGMAVAHVIRFLPPFRAKDVAIPHYHDVEFQMIYVLKGWIKTELAGQGEITMRAGSCWTQPPRIKHTVLDYSDDCEVLEVVLPADFETVTLD